MLLYSTFLNQSCFNSLYPVVQFDQKHVERYLESREKTC